MQNIGSTILRIVLGVIFAVHGFQKFQGGISYTADFFDSLGIPGFMAYIVAIIELVGGIAIILGLATRIFGALLTITMIVAIFTAKLSIGFIGADGLAGYELDLALGAIALYFTLAGASSFSLDSQLFGKE
ncbi:DoxX family protein [Lysinibacillus capsici]|uniref:DoxX family protein n=1 Tax=Lysinibacillus capsici TaxID=2115968 RepID=A0A2X0ZAM8_9BACI|nr:MULTISPECIES: DoxX family protein [Lysinibacillus]AUS85506.1 DoxX family protein [Lysinibacillus sp. YS11]KMN40426.1 oxidoreductase [Lysinibacillus sp. LK3]MCR6523308.1 DoxX family protein [Lysinibacillus capsici]MEC1303878.1 DoxX family protein [Lysinibacillus capsici]MED3875632.1 DoxX family protein [Lysinibacillus capsici]